MFKTLLQAYFQCELYPIKVQLGFVIPCFGILKMLTIALAAIIRGAKKIGATPKLYLNEIIYSRRVFVNEY